MQKIRYILSVLRKKYCKTVNPMLYLICQYSEIHKRGFEEGFTMQTQARWEPMAPGRMKLPRNCLP